MSFTSKLYAVFPKTVELLGKSFSIKNNEKTNQCYS